MNYEDAENLKLKDRLKKLLKDNLEINISTKTEVDYGNTSTNINVDILFDGEIISSSSDFISN